MSCKREFWSQFLSLGILIFVMNAPKCFSKEKDDNCRGQLIELAMKTRRNWTSLIFHLESSLENEGKKLEDITFNFSLEKTKRHELELILSSQSFGNEGSSDLEKSPQVVTFIQEVNQLISTNQKSLNELGGHFVGLQARSRSKGETEDLYNSHLNVQFRFLDDEGEELSRYDIGVPDDLSDLPPHKQENIKKMREIEQKQKESKQGSLLSKSKHSLEKAQALDESRVTAQEIKNVLNENGFKVEGTSFTYKKNDHIHLALYVLEGESPEQLESVRKGLMDQGHDMEHISLIPIAPQ